MGRVVAAFVKERNRLEGFFIEIHGPILQESIMVIMPNITEKILKYC